MDDWTFNPETGRVNDSTEFRRLVELVRQIISHSAHDLLHCNHEQVARTILACLTHKEGLAPVRENLERKAIWTR